MSPVYTRPHKRKLAKKSRTLSIYGKGDDEGKYFRCWNCGFICDKDRDEIGDAESNAGDDHIDYHSVILNEDPKDDIERLLGKICCLGAPCHYHVALEVGADGNPKTIVHDLTSDISRGCPMCGTVNWRGDY